MGLGLFFPHLQDFSQELHPLQEELLCRLQTSNDGALLVDNAERDLVHNTTISDYELGADDLFKAPEAIIEEPTIELDPVTACMIPSDDAIMERSATEDTFSEPPDVKIPALLKSGVPSNQQNPCMLEGNLYFQPLPQSKFFLNSA